MTEQKIIKVIIADDESHIRALIKRIVLAMGYRLVGEAANGQEAVELFRKEKPDLLLLDINMPVKTGLEALKEILDEFPNALVIMLTSVTDFESVETCLKLGAANYIRKDNPINEIRKMIAKTCNKS